MHGHHQRGLHDQPHERDRGRGLRRRAHGRPRHPRARTTTTRSAGRTRWTRRTSGPSRWPRHWGGTRNGTIVSWPNGIAALRRDPQPVRHVIDVAPTVLEAAGIPEPTTVHGVTQRPYEGTGDELHASTTRTPRSGTTTQYFEMLGNRAIYHKGWTAVAKHKDPWARLRPRPRRRRLGALQRRGGLDPVATTSPPRTRRSWPTCSAVPHPGRPVQRAADGHPLGRADQRGHRRPAAADHRATRRRFYPGMKRLSENSVINIKNKSFTVTADGHGPGRRRRTA